MKNTLSYPLKFVLRSYIIAVVVNSIVATAQILYDKDFTFSYLLQVFVFMFLFSLALYAIICLLLFIISAYGGMSREPIFWLLMAVSILIAIAGAILFKKSLHTYAKQPSYIIGIAGFSIMVSLASQYQFFHDQEAHPFELSSDNQ